MPNPSPPLFPVPHTTPSVWAVIKMFNKPVHKRAACSFHQINGSNRTLLYRIGIQSFYRSCRKDLQHKRRYKNQRSTSPITTSIEPMMAMRSAIEIPFAISGNTERFTKLHDLHLQRNATSLLPSDRKKNPKLTFWYFSPHIKILCLWPYLFWN